MTDNSIYDQLANRQIDQILRHAARGEWSQAREALADLKRNLPRWPNPVSTQQELCSNDQI